jgi:hypothetical protein
VLWRSGPRHVSGMIPSTDVAVLRRPLAVNDLVAAFGHTLPELLLQRIATQIQQQEPSRFGEIIACSQLHAPGGVVLLGDAAHAVTSSLGQGCNMALEGVRVFGDLLEESVLRGAMPLAGVPREYTRRRRADVHAMQQLELMSIIMRRGGHGLHLKGDRSGHVAHARITLGSAMLLGVAQWKLMPQRYWTVPMYDMLYDASVPYSAVLSYVRRTAASVCFAIGAAAVTTMLAVMQDLQS